MKGGKIRDIMAWIDLTKILAALGFEEEEELRGVQEGIKEKNPREVEARVEGMTRVSHARIVTLRESQEGKSGEAKE